MLTGVMRMLHLARGEYNPASPGACEQQSGPECLDAMRDHTGHKYTSVTLSVTLLLFMGMGYNMLRPHSPAESSDQLLLLVKLVLT
jgi:hypothetical protein